MISTKCSKISYIKLIPHSTLTIINTFVYLKLCITNPIIMSTVLIKISAGRFRVGGKIKPFHFKLNWTLA